MEFPIMHLCLLTLFHLIGGEMDNSEMSDTYSMRLNYILSTLGRIETKQRRMETRINDMTDDKGIFCRREDDEKTTISHSFSGNIKEGIDNIMKTIAAEKEYRQKFEDNIDEKIASQTTFREHESKIDSMEKTVTAFQASFNVLDSKLQAVLVKVAAMETTLDLLEGKVKIQNNIISKAETVSDAVEFKMKSMQRSMNEVGITTNDLQTRINTVEESIASSDRKKVCFYVQYRPEEETDAAPFKKQIIIPFNDVIYNDGSGYNGATGIFTVPISGVYQFIFFVEGWRLSDNSTCPAASVILYVDSCQTETTAVAHPIQKGQQIQSGNAYINYLNKGQEVFVATAGTCDEYTIFGYRTIFSGVLLY